ncbi:RmlC-like cupin domain-containing protein [Boletus edulis BED1]|uniref:RmlC-like cupin domain-containing protein n=1 Tax=Boletus edulis BED1 TaxID=1328754 RepID=A0AAD4C5C6_BOLED|nr:RmlC-like cupin domain-containing protein [Boletus edulis BED1]
MAVSRTVIKRVLAVETEEGAGARVRRSIGSANLRNLSPFLMLDHFHVSKGAGFPDHPHRGQATVTYMLEGSSRHEDSAGHAGTIETGGVQWMCAGKGIIHAEMPVHAPGVPEPRGLQLWVDLPKEFKMVEPSYQELGPASIPVAHPNGPESSISVRVISGKSHGVESPVRPLGGCWFFHVTMRKSGDSMVQDIPAGWTSFIYLWKGSIIVGDDGSINEKFHTLVLSNKSEETGARITATSDDTEFILVAGEPLDQTVFQYGPFVMTSREEIQQTLTDYQTGRNGFEKAHTWQSKIAH